jgi:polyisoprenoid-binding protein YceI
MLSAGVYEFGPESGKLQVRTSRAGAAARVGHDLLLEATQWSATLRVEPEWRLEATVDPGSLAVIEGTGGLKPLGESDRADIAKTIAGKILSVDKFPTIRFETTRPGTTSNGEAVRIGGLLHLCGRPGPVDIDVTTDEAGAGTRVSTVVPVVQSSFGIKPFSAMMGALKVADQVVVEVSATLAS